MSGALLSEIRVVNFRSARQLLLRPGPICAFIGEPGAGKSNALFALRALLDPGFDLASTDVTFGERDLSIEATLADGRDRLARRSRRRAADRPLPGGAPRRRLLERVDRRPARPGRCSASIREALARAPAPRVALVRGPRGVRRRGRGRRLRDRGARAVPRPAGAPLPLPPRSTGSPSAGTRSSSRRTRRACSASPRSRRSTSSRRDERRRHGGRAAARDRRRRRRSACCASSTPSAPSCSSRARRSSSRG